MKAIPAVEMANPPVLLSPTVGGLIVLFRGNELTSFAGLPSEVLTWLEFVPVSVEPLNWGVVELAAMEEFPGGLPAEGSS